MANVDVRCEPARDGGWRCRVTVVDGRSETRHEVLVSPNELAYYGAPGSTDPTDLVRASFAFLLEREPKESILRAFDLSVIERYFPEFRGWVASQPRGTPNA
jgi:hypothetical protein